MRPVWGMVLGGLLCAAGCSTARDPRAAAPKPAPAAPAERVLLDVPFFPDNTDQCGPAALAGLLAFWGDRVGPAALKSEVYLPQIRGSLPMDLMLAARRRGFRARHYRGGLEDLRRNLKQGHPLIAFTNRGYDALPVGHFVIVTGFDDRRGGVHVHSGTREDRFVTYKRFQRDWGKADWSTLLILPARKEKEASRARS